MAFSWLKFPSWVENRNAQTSLKQAAESQKGPDFVCIGSQKAGTRWLYDQLNCQPNVWMPPIKEISFLSNNCLNPTNLRIIDSGKSKVTKSPRPGDTERMNAFIEQFSKFPDHKGDFSWYKRLFLNADDRKTGDISPSNAVIPIKKVREATAELRSCHFIFLIRDPVDRLWSSVCMAIRKGVIDEKTATEWDSLLKFIHKTKVARNSSPSTIWRSWATHVPEDGIRFWFFDDIRSQPETVLKEICEFLEIDQGQSSIAANFNRKSKNAKIVLPSDIERKLTEHLIDEYEACAQLFGGHACEWLQRALARLH